MKTHARPRAAGGRGARDQRPAGRRRAERLAGGDREQDRRGEGDGGRHRLREDGRSTWPPTATASPARRSSRSSWCARCRTASAPRPRSRRSARSSPSRGGEPFVVNNYEDQYAGISSLRSATARSDNSVFAELGLKVGTQADRRAGAADGRAHDALDQPGDDARRARGGRDAARDGVRLLHHRQQGRARVGLAGLLPRRPGGDREGRRRRARRQEREAHASGCSPRPSARRPSSCWPGVVLGGTGRGAQIGEFAAGKTGTTENYGDAWFVGFNEELTVAVWVGYPDRLQLHGDRVRRRARGGRHLPDRDLARLHALVDRHPRAARRGAASKEDDDESHGDRVAPVAPAPGGPSTTPARRRRPTTARAAPASSREPASPRRSASPRRGRTHPRAAAHAGARARSRRAAAARAAAAPRRADGPPVRRPRRRGRRMAGGHGLETQRLERVAEAPRQLHRARDADARRRLTTVGARPRPAARISIGPSRACR